MSAENKKIALALGLIILVAGIGVGLSYAKKPKDN
jgi:hypothetical protein